MPKNLDRCRALLLGGALGDAYGRPLEFVTGPAVRTRPVSFAPDAFHWTDDTQMTLYLGQALLRIGPRFDPDAFGHAVGAEFAAWLRDPITFQLAPGNTCLAGARAYAAGGDWRTSGVRTSDGCGAVMRIGVLPLALLGEDLTKAARISAQVTHAHPNALEAAIAASHLLRWVIDEGEVTSDQVERAVALLDTLQLGGDVRQSLWNALAEAPKTSPWLDERAVHPGDGGWRAGSALGLAVTAALRFPRDFVRAVDLAARIEGDSDSVASIAGMLVGAANGTQALPAAWLAALPDRARIMGLADALVDAVPATTKTVRTSATDPIRVHWLELDSEGALGITFAPGKRGGGTDPKCTWRRDLDADLARLRWPVHAHALVCLLEDREIEGLGLQDYVARAVDRDLHMIRLPIPDGGVPDLTAARSVVRAVANMVTNGRRVVVHCRGGLGRAGTLAACCLIALGHTAEEAILRVRRARGSKAIERGRQEAFVRAFSVSWAPPLPPWWRPDGTDVYAGAVIVDGDRVLLRRLERHGYRWTFPRLRMAADGPVHMVDGAIAVATPAIDIQRCLPIPGTWRGDASTAQYWRLDGTAYTRLRVLSDPAVIARAAFGVQEPTQEQLDSVRAMHAMGLPLDDVGVAWTPERRAIAMALSALAPPPPPLPEHLNLEWVPIDEVERRLSETRTRVGRERDLAVWRAAAAVTEKPLFEDLGWVEQFTLRRSDERVSGLAIGDVRAGRLPFVARGDTIEYHRQAYLLTGDAARAGYAVEACFTCRHYRWSGMTNEWGSGWCWASRERFDDRRGHAPAGLGSCPSYERSLTAYPFPGWDDPEASRAR